MDEGARIDRAAGWTEISTRTTLQSGLVALNVTGLGVLISTFNDGWTPLPNLLMALGCAGLGFLWYDHDAVIRRRGAALGTTSSTELLAFVGFDLPVFLIFAGPAIVGVIGLANPLEDDAGVPTTLQFAAYAWVGSFVAVAGLRMAEKWGSD